MKVQRKSNEIPEDSLLASRLLCGALLILRNPCRLATSGIDAMPVKVRKLNSVGRSSITPEWPSVSSLQPRIRRHTERQRAPEGANGLIFLTGHARWQTRATSRSFRDAALFGVLSECDRGAFFVVHPYVPSPETERIAGTMAPRTGKGKGMGKDSNMKAVGNMEAVSQPTGR